MEGWLPARLADRSEEAKKSSRIWQVAGVNMQPWLCRMLQQLCTFPPRSLLLIMFPLSAACLCVTENWKISGTGISTVFLPSKAERKKGMPGADLDHHSSRWRITCSIMILPPNHYCLTKWCFRASFFYSMLCCVPPLQPWFPLSAVLSLVSVLSLSWSLSFCTQATVWKTGWPTISCNCQRISHPKCIRSVAVSIQMAVCRGVGGWGGQQAERPDPNLSLHKAVHDGNVALGANN